MPQLLQRIEDSPYFHLERPATAAELEAGEATWREWFGTPMPAVYRDLLAVSNGVDYNGLCLYAAVEYRVVENGVERWLPGIDSENSGYLYDLADQETRRFFGSADDDLFAYDTASRRWLVVDRSRWSGEPLAEFATLEGLLVDRLFCYLDTKPPTARSADAGPVIGMEHLPLPRSEKLVTSPDFESDRTDRAMPLDPDPAAPGVDADTPGVPAGSAKPVGEGEFVDGIEGVNDTDPEATETPIIPPEFLNETNTEG